MAKVKFKNNGVVLDAEEGTKLSECIRRANLFLETPCSSRGLCGKCKVRVYGEVSNPIKEELEFINGKDNIRLACLAEVKGDLEIELLENNNDIKTINSGLAKKVEVDSEIQKVTINYIDCSLDKSYLQSIKSNMTSLKLLGKIGSINKETEVSCVIYNHSMLDIGANKMDILGVALDIGTTGISAFLVNLENGAIVNKVSALNPQVEYGGDVLTRISFACNEKNGIGLLKNSVVEKVNEMIKTLVGEKYEEYSIYRIVVAANPTMLHLFAGVNPKSIAKAPYKAVFLEKLDLKAAEFGIDINEEGIVTLLPSASSYVGSDILAGVAATNFCKREKSSLFIDIGTNGEIVAIAKGKLVATSTAAGPALEGMNICCGVRAENGAIESFSIDDENNIEFSTIGNTFPIGICGSGLIDIAAQLVEKGIVKSSGRFNGNLNSEFKWRIEDNKFYITQDIYISQKDIRQIQLAKGAIAAGISMLLSELKLSIEEISEVVIAGAFGYHINAESIKKIGLIPKGFKGIIKFVGNSSVEGARLALINKSVMEDIVNFKDNIKVVELSTRDDFQKYFVEALSF
jgi:uncharacterized 2Fe-2S/4Fe-4S cluster protein (DUF4445 family)